MQRKLWSPALRLHTSNASDPGADPRDDTRADPRAASDPGPNPETD